MIKNIYHNTYANSIQSVMAYSEMRYEKGEMSRNKDVRLQVDAACLKGLVT